MSATEIANEDLQKVLDHIAVRDVALKVARATDRMDWDLMRTCYWPDAIDDHSHDFKGNVEEFIAWIDVALRNFEFSSHYLMNQLVELDGDVAWLESYCIAQHRTLATPEQPQQYDWHLNVRYCDKMERRNGEWRIKHRQLAWEGGQFMPVPTESVDADALPSLSTKGIGVPGRRDRSDRCYDRSV